ncbi:helix-turn-helix domain-containing protein [Bailinhaonella thermotolerans]|uniref:XRE family transcriptional regulator n=1 Tax=Bailinhaonella thermotolerans TaxID=1070861 RepID=A0A3A3ZYX4_9ACTN|nr:helix-turn-helix transcriptional regulator [Bailinhaonella thermotolerans]RJL20788.1 XRE family transcriptional regulator [Bailinhaonella thermotolerans]
MADSYSPTVRLRRLADELKRMREARKLTMEQVAQQLEWSRGKLSRLEAGLAKRPSVHDVRLLCDVYGMRDERVREALVALARDARKRGWWSAYKDVLTGSFIGLESEASEIRTFQPLIVPGLLQTREYAREMVLSSMVDDPHEVERRVEARIERQKILARDDAPRIWAVIDEAALARPVGGPDVWRGQLRRLIETRELEHVTVLVLPMGAGPHPGLAGQFVLLDFPGELDRPVVYLETATDSLYLEQPSEIDRYRVMFDRLLAMALSTEESIGHLEGLIDGL